MVTQSNFCFSPSAAARILGVSISNITGFQVWSHVAWVRVAGTRPRFISLAAFRSHFVAHRKAQAKELQVIKSSMVGGYVVRNQAKGSQYICTPYRDRIECACEDYKNQMLFNPLGLRRPVAACKHVYAVLSELGHSSLKEYLAAQ